MVVVVVVENASINRQLFFHCCAWGKQIAGVDACIQED